MTITVSNKALTVGRRIGGARRCTACNGRGRTKAKGEQPKTCTACLGSGYAKGQPYLTK